MRNADELIISGIQSSNILGGVSLLQGFISIEELLNSLPREHLLLEHFSASYERSVNKERLSRLESYYLKGIVNNTPFDVPRVCLVAHNKVRDARLQNRLVRLHYERTDIAIVDGFLAISALSNLLERADPFTGKKSGQSVLTTEQKQVLSSIDVRLSIYYKRDGNINEEELAKLFLNINTTDTRVYSQSITVHAQESPLNSGAEKLALALNLDALGGISNLNKITKSDSYVTTKNTLILIILASLGGKGARVEKHLPTHLPSGVLVTERVIDDTLEVVIPFMRGWISCLATKFKQDSNGFHRSMQIWQALGVVAYDLANNGSLTESELFAFGRVLGQLDYDKSASHWGKCSAFKKDVSGKIWINATGGGRTFRDQVASYFISIL
ncbi:hypothetical protein [Vibrio crassostreae]|uniref:hypothetical protein n=1 Tax=Vibrio crassostreae TaxID=246167 RepID=UPI001B309C82|nr:hypothetical protein [Vibrio crassostreae]